MNYNYTKQEIEEMRLALWINLYDGTWNIDDLADIEVIEYFSWLSKEGE